MQKKHMGKLEKFKEGEDDGKWLKKLKQELIKLKSQMRCQKDEEKNLEGDIGDLEDSAKRLEKEEERLKEEEKKSWGEQYRKLQDALVEYDSFILNYHSHTQPLDCL